MNIAFIPLRGGSKSIPLKNIKPFAGKPLAYWTIKAACECSEIDTVYVSTDSDVISDIITGFGFQKLKVIKRSTESATDTASTEIGMLEFAKNHDCFSNIALIQATSPFLTSDDIKKGFAVKRLNEVDSVLSVVRQKRFIWHCADNGYAKPLNYDFMNRPRRQDFDGFLVENGAFYITSREALLQSGCRLSGNIKTVEMPEYSYVELDEPGDWDMTESLFINKIKAIKLPKIKMFLADCDGTLTDGGMYYSEHGEEIKKFNTRDGAGLRMLKERGIVTGIITGEMSEIVRKRAKKICVDEVHLGISNKLATINQLCAKYGFDIQNVAYIGDDLNDYEALCNVGLGICVADSVKEIKKISVLITNALGGGGAVREAADFILDSVN